MIKTTKFRNGMVLVAQTTYYVYKDEKDVKNDNHVLCSSSEESAKKLINSVTLKKNPYG